MHFESESQSYGCLAHMDKENTASLSCIVRVDLFYHMGTREFNQLFVWI